MNKLKTLVIGLALLLWPAFGFAQTTVTQTTLSAAITTTNGTLVTVASATGISASSNTQTYWIVVDQEAMQVTAVSGTNLTVIRGIGGSRAHTHASSAIVYFGPSGSTSGSPFVAVDPPLGSCTSANETYSLRINTQNGRIWQCTNSSWANVVDAYVFIGPGSCNSSVSGNSTGTNGFTVLGTAPSIPVVQAQTSASGTNTHYYTCNVPVTGRLATARGAWIVDVEFYYGVQTTALGTQVATLSSGTMNSKTVFQTIAYPTPGTSETATGLAEAARADSGTLLITPVVGSFNTGTTTAGEFFSVKFTPASPISLSTDHQQVFFTVSLLGAGTAAGITNSPGFLAHYRYVSGE